MKKLVVSLAIITLLVIGVNANAITMDIVVTPDSSTFLGEIEGSLEGEFLGGIWIEGYVRDQNGNPIAGATLEWRFLDGTFFIQTNSQGYYGFLYNRNWCDYKRVIVSATGYFTRQASVGDGTCCNCYEECLPEPCQERCPNRRCATYKVVNFTLIGFDSDADGVLNGADNCPYVPNGPDKGTCTRGTVGRVCYPPGGGCGCTGFCSLNQEDSDGDGIGDACDNTQFQATALGGPTLALSCVIDKKFNERFPYLCNPELEGATEADITQEKILFAAPNRQIADLATIIVALFPQFYCLAQGGCDYDCLGQAIEDFLNGRDAFLGWWIYPGDEKRPFETECPDRVTFVEFVNQLLRDTYCALFSQNFPDQTFEECRGINTN